MSAAGGLAKRSHEENWLPILELAIQEVFDIMLGCQAKPVAPSEHKTNAEFTAMVGLAGALCGILTVCCDANTAHQIATRMLGDAASSEEQAADALGEMCNMITGNFESGSSRTGFSRLSTSAEQAILALPLINIAYEPQTSSRQFES